MYDTRNKPWTGLLSDYISSVSYPPPRRINLPAIFPKRRRLAGERDWAKIWPANSLTQDILSLFIQEEELHYNVTAGIVLSDHSLVLQSITRESAGRYTCMAVNVEGRASSNVVNLEVMCEYILLLSKRRRAGKKKKKKRKEKKERVLWLAKVGDKSSKRCTLVLSDTFARWRVSLPRSYTFCHSAALTHADLVPSTILRESRGDPSFLLKSNASAARWTYVKCQRPRQIQRVILGICKTFARRTRRYGSLEIPNQAR